MDTCLAEFKEGIPCPSSAQDCPARFKTSAELKKHLLKECPAVQVTCSMCDETMARTAQQDHYCGWKLLDKI